MELTGLIRHMKMNKSKAVTIDCSIPTEYPGYVRTVTIMQDNLVSVEFEVYGYDEGGITYFIQYENFEILIKMMEEYLEKKIGTWENINQTGYYPNEIYVKDIELVHKKIEEDLVNDKIKIPIGGIKTWIPEGYWKRFYDERKTN